MNNIYKHIHIAQIISLALAATGQEHEPYQEDVGYIAQQRNQMSPAKRLLIKNRLARAKKLSKSTCIPKKG